MSKWVAVIGLTLFAVFASAAIWGILYVNDQTQRCAAIGADYAGPGVCKFTEERRVLTP